MSAGPIWAINTAYRSELYADRTPAFSSGAPTKPSLSQSTLCSHVALEQSQTKRHPS